MDTRRRMKPRHATALALAVWYLMYQPNMPNTVVWTHKTQSFKSKRDCEHFAESERTKLEHSENPRDTTMLEGYYVSALLDKKAVCMRDDDPRLKEFSN
jgi:hypothetical protein